MKTRGVEAYYRSEHDAGNPHVLRTPDDVDDVIDILLQGDQGGCAAELIALDRPLTSAGFPDHVFIIGARRDRNAGVLLSGDGDYEEPDANMTSAGNMELDDDVVLYQRNDGGSYEFPISAEIPIDKLRGAVKEFVASGGKRPRSIEWHVSFYM